MNWILAGSEGFVCSFSFRLFELRVELFSLQDEIRSRFFFVVPAYAAAGRPPSPPELSSSRIIFEHLVFTRVGQGTRDRNE
jgi:hypothetical protein